jgi:spermidine synthase
VNSRKNGSLFITLLFVLSGLSGLVYEVVWVRFFGLVFGNTVFASSTVLSVFMAGLALGSWLIGKYVDRAKNPLRVYALLEAGIGISGMLVPVLIRAALPLYAIVFRNLHPTFYQISLIRLMVSFLILIVPCTLMGGTLPVISTFIAGAFRGSPANQSGRLYAANTFGAVIGALVSGYLFIGTIGLLGTTATAALLNLVIAGAIFIYSKQHAFRRDATVAKANPAVDASEAAKSISLKPSQVKTVIALYGLSGCLSLFLEVAWTRSLVWIMGMDAYAFASMLAVFLFGLALGSYLLSRFAGKSKNPVVQLGIIQLLIGLSVLVSGILIGRLYLLRQFFENSLPTASFGGSVLFLLALAAAIMAIPALFMGMAFPFALRVSINGRMAVGRSVGTLYAANTIGSVVGALLAGFIALPLLGVMKSIVLAGGTFLLVASALLIAAGGRRTPLGAAASIAPGALGLLLILSWAPNFADALAQGLNHDERLLYFKETVTGDVEVTESRSEGTILRIDGRQVASDGPTDLPSHKYPAHLVSLLKDHPQSALFIAFGAGGTAGSILRYNELERLDAVEICSGVIEPDRRYFTEMNHDALDDPRLHLIIQDGKNYVRLTDRTYDIIYSGPIHPQSNQGSAALYTRDFFADCRTRLNRGGIQCVWLPLHMPPEDYKLIVKSFQQVYPHSSLWLTPGSPNTISHTHLIGSIDPLIVDFNRVNAKLTESSVIADIGQLNYVSLSNCADLIGECVLGEDELRTFTADVAGINTDNLPRAEFYRKIGRKIYDQNRECPALLLADILRCRARNVLPVVDISPADRTALESNLAEYYTGDSLRILGHISFIRSNVLTERATISKEELVEAFGHYRDAYQYYLQARRYLPDDRYIGEFIQEAEKMFARMN